MSKDMLGSVVRAAVGVPQGRLNLLAKIASMLAGDNPNGDKWYSCLKKLEEEGLPAAAPIDTIIRVNRSVRLDYPDWVNPEGMRSPEFLALASAGPSEYDLAEHVEQWLHERQKGGESCEGQVIYDFLRKEGQLASHLGLADALAIQQKGIAFFREHFDGKTIFFWRTVVRHYLGHSHVPCLTERAGKVVLFWPWLSTLGSGIGPALRLR